MKTGIWIDSKKAWISTHDNGQELFFEIESEVEDTHPAGGYGGKVPYGPQNAHPEDKVQNRREHQFDLFFKDIINQIKGSEEVVVEGPADVKKKLLKKIKESHGFGGSSLIVKSSDSMTENQFKAGVREYFQLMKEKPVKG